MRDRRLWLPRKISKHWCLVPLLGWPHTVDMHRPGSHTDWGLVPESGNWGLQTLGKSFHLSQLQYAKSKIGMQICPAALSPPGLSICSFSLVFCQLDSQSIFLLDLEAAWLPDPKAQDHLDSSFIQLLKSPFKKQEPALTLPYLLGTQVSFLIISHPGSTAPAPPVGQIPVALASG